MEAIDEVLDLVEGIRVLGSEPAIFGPRLERLGFSISDDGDCWR